MISLPHLQHVSSIIQVIPQALLPFQFLCSTSSVINLNLINFVGNMNIIYKIYIRQTWQFIHKIYLFFYLLHFLKEAFALLLFFEAEKQSSSELFKSSEDSCIHENLSLFVQLCSRRLYYHKLYLTFFLIVATRENVRSDLGVFDHKMDLMISFLI